MSHDFPNFVIIFNSGRNKRKVREKTERKRKAYKAPYRNLGRKMDEDKRNH